MRSWRRKVRPVFLLVLMVPCIAAAVVGVMTGQIVGVVCGVCAGGLGIAWMILRDSPPTYLENLRRGVEGEQRTRRELLKLGWHFVEDVPDSHGNFDHIVVGPAGVFHLETKYPTGIAEIVDGSLRVRGRHGEDRPSALNVRGRLLGGSAALCREIERHCGRGVWVSGVVVLWSPFPQRIVEAGQVTYLHGKELRAWLSRHKPSIDQSRVALLEGVLNAIKHERDQRAQKVVAVKPDDPLPGSAEAC